MKGKRERIERLERMALLLREENTRLKARQDKMDAVLGIVAMAVHKHGIEMDGLDTTALEQPAAASAVEDKDRKWPTGWRPPADCPQQYKGTKDAVCGKCNWYHRCPFHPPAIDMNELITCVACGEETCKQGDSVCDDCYEAGKEMMDVVGANTAEEVVEQVVEG